MSDITETAPDGVAPFAGNMTTQDKLADALRGIVELGKRDLTNPKYDGYFDAAREALAAHDAQPAPLRNTINTESVAQSTRDTQAAPEASGGRAAPAGEGCGFDPRRTPSLTQPAPAPVQVDDGWHRMTQAARDMQARHLDNHQGDVYHAMQSLVGRFGAPRTGPMIQDRSTQPPAPGEADEFDKPAMELTALRKKLAAAEDATKSAGEACDDYEYMYQESRATQIRAAIAALQKATGNQGESA